MSNQNEENSLLKIVINQICTKTLSAPFTLIRERMLLNDEFIRQGIIDIPYSGYWNCMARITSEEGFFSLWKGNAVNIACGIATGCIGFVISKYLGNLLKVDARPKKGFKGYIRYYSQMILKGFALSTIPKFLAFPIEVARIKMAYQTVSGSAPIQIHKQIYKRSGIMGGFQGFKMLILSSLIGGIAQEFISHLAADNVSQLLEENSKYYSHWISKRMAQSIAMMIEYPMNLIIKRMIMGNGTEFQYKDNQDCVETIYSNGGYSAFYRNGLWTVIGSGITTFVYIFAIIRSGNNRY